ncbi:MAG: hypothetical protein Q8P99_01220 [bacterium]|nr:hypothetical protein [bacterium]MDZ4231187.1 hypothetical protein [Patescibacteria group bacterium]
MNGNPFEGIHEPVFTPEEVQELFEQLGVREFEDVRRLEDERGLYLWDIAIPGEDGGTEEYSYMRGGRYPEGQASITAIHKVFYDKDGTPIGGQSVAKYIEGEWILTLPTPPRLSSITRQEAYEIWINQQNE